MAIYQLLQTAVHLVRLPFSVSKLIDRFWFMLNSLVNAGSVEYQLAINWIWSESLSYMNLSEIGSAITLIVVTECSMT